MAPRKPPYAEFAHRLFIAQKRWELKAGKSLDRDALARVVGKSDSTVSNWFTGKAMPSVEQLAAIARFFDASAAYLAFGDQSVMMGPDGETLGSPAPSSQENHPPKKHGRKR